MKFDITDKFKEKCHFDTQVESNETTQQEHQVQNNIQLNMLNNFVQDTKNTLNKIVQILRKQKQNYFSNASYSSQAYTDQRRQQFDVQVKKSLQISNAKISQLKNMIDLTEFASRTQSQHMKSVVLCLYQIYKFTLAQFNEFQKFNILRKEKLNRAIAKQQIRQRLHKTQIFKKTQQNIDPQLQKQGQLIFHEKAQEQTKLYETKKIVQNINQMVSLFSNRALQQQILTSSFLQIGQVGLFHLELGNKNLIEANALSKSSGKYWITYFLTLAISLLIFDFIKS